MSCSPTRSAALWLALFLMGCTGAATIGEDAGPRAIDAATMVAPARDAGPRAMDGGVDTGPSEDLGPPRYVFAHYMVAIRAYGGSVEGYVREIEEARAHGIDGFALNLAGYSIANYRRDLAAIFEAVEQVERGFLLFLSPDMCCGLLNNDLLEMAATYMDHPAYLRHEGRPVLSGYGIGWTDGAHSRWTNLIAEMGAMGHDVFFIPHAWMPNYAHQPAEGRIREQYAAWWDDVLDGYFYFGGAMLPEYRDRDSLLTIAERFARVTHERGKLYMAPVSPQYWGSKQESVGRRYYEYQGGEGLERQWRSIIEQQNAEWVELVTWNDFDEASYFSPNDDVNSYWPYLDRRELGFYNEHGGLLALNHYFADWFRSRDADPPPAPGGVDHLYCAYRIHPKDAMASGDPRGRVTWRYGDVEDVIYVTTITLAPAELRVTTGGRTHTRMIPAGLHHERVPFDVGPQRLELWRGGTIIAALDGEDVVAEPTFYNFHYTTAHAQGAR